jgi:hypothetical protein
VFNDPLSVTLRPGHSGCQPVTLTNRQEDDSWTGFSPTAVFPDVIKTHQPLTFCMALWPLRYQLVSSLRNHQS